MILQLRRPHKRNRVRARGLHGWFVCRCGSRHFEIRKERVARKVHTRTARRKRIIAICEKHGHVTRIGFPS